MATMTLKFAAAEASLHASGILRLSSPSLARCIQRNEADLRRRNSPTMRRGAATCLLAPAALAVPNPVISLPELPLVVQDLRFPSHSLTAPDLTSPSPELDLKQLSFDDVSLPGTGFDSSQKPNSLESYLGLRSFETATLADISDASITVGPPKFDLPAKATPILDAAKVLTPSRAESLAADIIRLEETTGFRLRILTRYAPGTFDADDIRRYWQPDERTAIVILDVTSPNIFNFNNTGNLVRKKLPRQFFIELQSRFGNQFFVSQEGDQEALLEAAGVLITCLSSPEGCARVPGLSDDLFFLTLATSIAGGAVFGFALRQEPTGQVTATWQWVLLFSPLWFILFVALGLQPIASRTSDVEPLLKDTAGFLFSAAAVYLTPILGQTPASKWLAKKDEREP